ncbi:glycosyltransferase [Cellulomonas sp. PhB150]|uniref:glycosyltransferase n=1 Tax=Cellulomonas sp. PhB150 TaxID=2485188 RepID=UPI000F468F43|nr:glycosyltransferase [Cellulomonas sp. PhB150]ROS22979.1 glycosyltransferase involved in cell wall biosynthesis [Cellulomonas sp. PhB150]
MRIVSVVTLFTPDGAYGGPTRVALNQARALRAAGHEVELAAAATGYDGPLPRVVDGIDVRLFPARRILPGTGFAGLASPALQRWLARALPGADVAHVHLARDLITLPAVRRARRVGTPYVLQTHGMIDASSHPLAAPLDALWTRPALHHASHVLHLTERERRDLTGIAGRALPFVELSNGIDVPPASVPASPPEVLFLARLAERKRPTVFVRAAQRLAPAHPDTAFTLVGPDEGEGEAVRALLADDDADGRIRWTGALPLDATQDRVARATVSVLPSVDEPFPMSVIEAMAAGVPVVVTDTCGLASRVERAGAGVVVGPDVDALVAAVGRLLDDPAAARAAGDAGRALCADELSMRAVLTTLEEVYRASVRDAVGAPRA